MPTLAAPQTATYTTVSPQEFVNVICTGATDVMLVSWVGPAGTSGQRTVRNTTSAGEDIGPLLDGTTVTFTAQAGAPVYSAPAFSPPVQALVSGYGIFRRPPQTLRSGWQGRMQALADAADHTSTYYRTLETHTDRIYVWVANPIATDIINVKVLVSTSDTMPGLLGSLAGSTTTPGGIISGGTSVASAPFTALAGTDNFAPTWTRSPAIDISTIDRVDGGTLPLIRVRVERPIAGNPGTRPAYLSNSRAGWEDPANVAGRVMKCRSDAALGATTGGAGGSTAFSSTTWPIIIEYVPRNGYGYSVFMVGDSTMEAVDSEIEGYGWAYMARDRVSTLAAPIEICQLAMGSAQPGDFVTRATAAVNAFNPELLVCAMFSPNGITAPTYTETGNSRLMYRATQQIKAACAAKDTIFVGWSGIPTKAVAPDSTTGNKDFDAASVIALNKYMASLLSSRDRPIDAYTAVLGGYDADGQATLKAGAAATPNFNLHLSAAGNQLVSVPFESFLRTVMPA